LVCEAFHQFGILLRTQFRELIVEQVYGVVRIALKSRQGILEITGIDSPFLLKALLHLLSGYDAGSNFFVEQHCSVFDDLRAALADFLNASGPRRGVILRGARSWLL